jgi:predicted GH43/DUF377 family glycosyl hydrolase
MTSASQVLTDTGIDLRSDMRRVLLRFFVPGREEVGPGASRAGSVIDRVMALDDADVAAELASLRLRFGERHPDLDDVFAHHADLATTRLGPAVDVSLHRRLLLGAAFSHEYSIEGAALCNPSIVAHPDGPDADGATRFVMAVRGIGEGHRSSIGFRCGTVAADGLVSLDPAGTRSRAGSHVPGIHHRSVVHRKLRELDDDHDNAAYVLDSLPDRFDGGELDRRLQALRDDAATRRHASSTEAHLRRIARASYRVEFSHDVALGGRVLWPHAPDERNGMEDARFLEITDGSAPRYCATYTAFDGTDARQYLLTTEDFRSFDIGPMAGAAASGKGLALFPRLVGGRHLALSRADRESNALAASDDLRCWDRSTPLQQPTRRWEVVQLGNCGSPIETGRGWLVLTHGVGPMRTYSIGAILLDLDEPHRVIGATTEPLLTPGVERQDGYVPNVVYTCGALVVGERLVVPYAIGDQRIAIAVGSLDEVLDAMDRR